MAASRLPVKIRQLAPGDYNTIMDWMLEERWHISENMIEGFYQLDPEGFLVAEAEDGELLGCVDGTIHDTKVATGGLFIVRPKSRGRGVGMALWDARLKHLQGRNLGISAVADRVEPNKRKGFTYLSFEVTTYCGLPKKDCLPSQEVPDNHIKEYSPSSFEELLQYDNIVHTVPRPNYLKTWVNPDSTVTYIARGPDGISGYGCIQPTHPDLNLWHLGPLYAKSDAIAGALISKLVQKVPQGVQVGLDIITGNAYSKELVKAQGFQLDLTLTRMYNTGMVDLPTDQVYALSTCGPSLL